MLIVIVEEIEGVKEVDAVTEPAACTKRAIPPTPQNEALMKEEGDTVPDIVKE